MTDVFDAMFPTLHKKEGGDKYTNRAADLGGPTKHGVTAKKLGEFRKLGRPATAAEVMALGFDEAYRIYRKDFFEDPKFNLIAAISPKVAEELLDTGVNMGTHWPAVWLQMILNMSNRRGKDWADIGEDGDIGNATLGALKAMVRLRGLAGAEKILLNGLNGEQYARYRDIVRRGGPNSEQEENFCGWVSQRVGF